MATKRGRCVPCCRGYGSSDLLAHPLAVIMFTGRGRCCGRRRWTTRNQNASAGASDRGKEQRSKVGTAPQRPDVHHLVSLPSVGEATSHVV